MDEKEVSLIIPAYNEEGTITRCLNELTSSDQSSRLEIIVVCNGCSDRTEILARKFEPAVTVLSTPVASKTKAITLGEAKARFYPIFYVDSDILVRPESILGVADHMKKNGTPAASPDMRIALPKNRTLIQRYYTIWSDIQTHKGKMLGSGVYAISEKGRKRFGIFPEIINDDAYVSLHFNADEREIVELYSFTIFPPKKISDLIRIKTRTKIGNLFLKKNYPELFKKKEGGVKRHLFNSIAGPINKVSLLVYITIRLVVVINTYRLLTIKKQIPWYQDESSRI